MVSVHLASPEVSQFRFCTRKKKKKNHGKEAFEEEKNSLVAFVMCRLQVENENVVADRSLRKNGLHHGPGAGIGIGLTVT